MKTACAGKEGTKRGVQEVDRLAARQGGGSRKPCEGKKRGAKPTADLERKIRAGPRGGHLKGGFWSNRVGSGSVRKVGREACSKRAAKAKEK